MLYSVAVVNHINLCHKYMYNDKSLKNPSTRADRPEIAIISPHGASTQKFPLLQSGLRNLSTETS